MSFRFLGTRFDISVPFAVVIAFLLVMDKTGLMTASLLAVLVHESGHLIAMRLNECAPQSVRFTSTGVLICGSSFCTAKENILIAVSGPAANFLIAGVLLASGYLFDLRILIVYSAVQIVVGAINLMPVRGLDGGTVLFLLLKCIPRINSGMVFSFISIITACAVTVAGTAIAVRNIGNPSLLLLGLYLIILNIMKT